MKKRTARKIFKNCAVRNYNKQQLSKAFLCFYNQRDMSKEIKELKFSDGMSLSEQKFAYEAIEATCIRKKFAEVMKATWEEFLKDGELITEARPWRDDNATILSIKENFDKNKIETLYEKEKRGLLDNIDSKFDWLLCPAPKVE